MLFLKIKESINTKEARVDQGPGIPACVVVWHLVTYQHKVGTSICNFKSKPWKGCYAFKQQMLSKKTYKTTKSGQYLHSSVLLGYFSNSQILASIYQLLLQSDQFKVTFNNLPGRGCCRRWLLSLSSVWGKFSYFAWPNNPPPLIHTGTIFTYPIWMGPRGLSSPRGINHNLICALYVKWL